MAIWHAREGLEALSPFMSAVYQNILEHLDEWGDGAAKIVSIETQNERGMECPDCLFTFALPEGLVAEIAYCAADAQHIFYDLEVTDVEWASDFVNDVLRSLRYKSYRSIADAVHGQLKGVRKTFAAWLSKYGIAADVLDTKLRWTEWQRYTGEFPHIISVAGLGEDLQPDTFDLELRSCSDPAPQLAELFADLSRRHAAKAALNLHGADGSIDMLALRALKAEGPVQPELRNWKCLSPSYGPFNVNLGRISIEKIVHAKHRIRFAKNRITVYGMELPETVLLKCVGRPITDLLVHAFLSPEMIIVDARNAISSSEKHFAIEFTQPVYYFCSVSGRYGR
ncbi:MULTISPECIES: hypothetical protein [Citromicrobium]|uniref:hypothetical protein n=1 Tax=Citromicrobium TaxID=72173 RepID=UPI0001DD0A05|nr:MULTISPECIES: hypothetical protein [Citromicrobium]ALG60502.1 hypothetical protein WG74_06355 [Citromicrobium sp. JL477]